MFPSLRFTFAAVLSALVILVIASSALISTRRPDVPMVLQPVGSRSLASNWMNDAQSFEARFGPQAMLVNASVQLPPVDRSRPSQMDFVASANAAIDPAKPARSKTVDPKTIDSKPAESMPADANPTGSTPAVDAAKPAEPNLPGNAVAAATPPVPAPAQSAPAPAIFEEPAAVTAASITPPPVTVAALPERLATPSEPTKIETPSVAAAIEPAPVPPKDPQTASDAPAQPSQRIALAPSAAPAAAPPAFVDNSRTEKIAKPAIKKRAQVKRPAKRRVARIVRPAPVAAKPKVQTPTNPFAALFGQNGAN